jgi:hypothetical protein
LISSSSETSGGGIGRQRRPEESGEIHDHPLGDVGPLGQDQGGKRVQGVEQEVRIDLVAQGPKLRLLRFPRECGGAAIGRAKLRGVAHRDIKRRPGSEQEVPGKRALGDVVHGHLIGGHVPFLEIGLGRFERRKDIEDRVIDAGEGGRRRESTGAPTGRPSC